MKIYFSGSIGGGREKVGTYIKIVDLLKQYGEVLTEHVADPNMGALGAKELDSKQVYEGDCKKLDECDLVVAEITVPSLGVGYELGYADKLHKRVICVYEARQNVSAMIRGNGNFEFIPYDDTDELLKKLKEIL